MTQLARILVITGLSLAGLGLLLLASDKLGLGLGRLPGDLLWKRKNTTVYFPIVTSIVVSVVLTLLLNLLMRRK